MHSDAEVLGRSGGWGSVGGQKGRKAYNRNTSASTKGHEETFWGVEYAIASLMMVSYMFQNPSDCRGTCMA